MSHTSTTTFAAVTASVDIEWLMSVAGDCDHEPADEKVCPSCLAYLRAQEITSKAPKSPAQPESATVAGDAVLWEGRVPQVLAQRVRVRRNGIVEHRQSGSDEWVEADRGVISALTAGHLARLLAVERRAHDATRQAVAAQADLLLAIVESEPELDGEPPAAIMDELRRDPVSVLRSTVRATKASIARRARAALNERAPK